MALLAVPILVWACRVGMPRLHSVIPHHAFVTPVELLQVAHVVHRARQAVGTVLGRRRAQFPTRVLPSFAEALQALRIADRARLPVRVGQHEVVYQMFEHLAFERDPQLGHVCEVRRAQPPRRVLLAEVHLLRRALRGPPQLDPPLQGPDLPIAELPWAFPLQPLEQRLGLQLRTVLPLPLNCVPYLAERILPRPPMPLPLQLAGQAFQTQIP